MEVHVIEPQLNEAVFGVRTRPHLLHQTVLMQLANRRSGSAATKSKGWVRGGGKKPWRQKGTGRARSGSIRSPIWVGGGTVFGPQPRDYSYRMPRTARRAALLSALSMKRRDGKLVVVDKLALDAPKTKHMAEALAQLKITSVLIVIAQADATIERATRNLPKAKVLRVDGLNVYDLMRYEHLILTADALHLVEERLAA